MQKHRCAPTVPFIGFNFVWISSFALKCTFESIFYFPIATVALPGMLSINDKKVHTGNVRIPMCLHLKKSIKQNFNVRRYLVLLCFYPASYIQHEQLMGIKTACGLWFRVAGRLWVRILELRLGTHTQACTFLTRTKAVALTRCRRSGRGWLYAAPTHHLSWKTNGGHVKF